VSATQTDVLPAVDMSAVKTTRPNGPGDPGPEPHRADRDKEDSRKYRRTVFDFKRWREHRSTKRYQRHIVGIGGSRIVRGLAGPLWFVVIVSVGVGTYESVREAGLLPVYLPSISVTNTAPFNLSSFALSLLLVFRTNSSYSRWDEARKLWGGVTNRSRDLMRQADSWFPEAEADLLDLVERWTVAFCRTLMTHLREDGDIEAEMKGVLQEHELATLISAQHRPNYVLSVISMAIEESHTTDAARVRMDENLTFFADALGACERILKTPIPLTYTRHTSRFLVIWLAFLPFTLWHACGWGTVPVSVTIAFLLLGIEEIGVTIEEPFAILPLEAICDTITRNCVEMHDRRNEQRSLAKSVIKPRNIEQERGPLFRSPGRREYDAAVSGK
jgi:predicted membrane chloride channel (bestrophin family)